MFPFKKSCELSFQVSSSQQGDETMDSGKAKADDKRKRHAEDECTAGGGGGEGGGSKKIQHRDNERQRRVVMAALLNTLRSLLPLEFIKGKRSVCDHISETTNFIKYLQDNITRLQRKRSTLPTYLTCPPPDHSPSKPRCSSVSVSITNLGLDIQISCDAPFRISGPLKLLLQQGINVACLLSTNVNGVFHHNIQCHQVSDDFDVQWLQQRLHDVVSGNGTG